MLRCLDELIGALFSRQLLDPLGTNDSLALLEPDLFRFFARQFAAPPQEETLRPAISIIEVVPREFSQIDCALLDASPDPLEQRNAPRKSRQLFRLRFPPLSVLPRVAGTAGETPQSHVASPAGVA